MEPLSGALLDVTSKSDILNWNKMLQINFYS